MTTVVVMVAAVGVAIEVARAISMAGVGVSGRGAANCDERNHCGDTVLKFISRLPFASALSAEPCLGNASPASWLRDPKVARSKSRSARISHAASEPLRVGHRRVADRGACRPAHRRQLLASNSPTSSRTDWRTRGSKLMLHQAAKSLVVLAVAMSLAVVPINDAQARRGRGIAVGIAVGIIALAIIGAEAKRHRHKRRHRQIQRQAEVPERHAQEPERRAQEPECEWRGRTCYKNSYGSNVCEGGEYVCRPQ